MREIVARTLGSWREKPQVLSLIYRLQRRSVRQLQLGRCERKFLEIVENHSFKMEARYYIEILAESISDNRAQKHQNKIYAIPNPWLPWIVEFITN